MAGYQQPIFLLFQVHNGEMVEICEIQNIVDTIVGSVQLSQVHQKVQAMQLWDPTGTNRENLQRGDLLTKNPENISILENVSFSFHVQVQLFIVLKTLWQIVDYYVMSQVYNDLRIYLQYHY